MIPLPLTLCSIIEELSLKDEALVEDTFAPGPCLGPNKKDWRYFYCACAVMIVCFRRKKNASYYQHFLTSICTCIVCTKTKVLAQNNHACLKVSLFFNFTFCTPNIMNCNIINASLLEKRHNANILSIRFPAQYIKLSRHEKCLTYILLPRLVKCMGAQWHILRILKGRWRDGRRYACTRHAHPKKIWTHAAALYHRSRP